MSLVSLLKIAKKEKQPRCPSGNEQNMVCLYSEIIFAIERNTVQAHLGQTAGSVPDLHNKVSIVGK